MPIFRLFLWLKVKVKVKVTQSCPTLCDSMDSIVHGILQARILECVAFPFSQGLNPGLPYAGRFFTSWATREALWHIYLGESEVTQWCPTLCDPMDYSLPGSSIHRIFQARVLEWVAISFYRGSSQSRDWTWVSHIAGRRFTIWAAREAPYLGNQAK